MFYKKKMIDIEHSNSVHVAGFTSNASLFSLYFREKMNLDPWLMCLFESAALTKS